MTTLSHITRRDFLGGMALGVAAGSTLTPLELLARANGGTPYPPALTGMRGSQPGSFEVAHALGWQGVRWPRPEALTDDVYDLVVVGGGLSGLAAAYLFRQRGDANARILVLDNHDDFGGHARRNEFVVDGQLLICYGGSQSIDTPKNYSVASKKLLEDVGIFTGRFYDYFDRGWEDKRGLGRGTWFSAEEYGRDLTLPGVLGTFGRGVDRNAEKVIDRYPLSDVGRAGLKRLLTEARDYLAERSREEKIALMRRTSYADFLVQHAGVPKEVSDLFRDSIRGYWGVGWDSLSALEGYRLGMPGTYHLGVGELVGEPPGRDEPYIFHFPDGNAGIARALVRELVSGAIPGSTMEDLVLARADYDALDDEGSKARIRLNSTAVDVRHAQGGSHVDVTYVRNGEAERVRARHAILACYNRMVPHLCPELPDAQRAAIEAAVKVPLVYISVAVRNWHAFANLGYSDIQVPKPRLMHSFGLDFPVSMGGYEFTQSPDEPTVIHGTFVPAYPDEGLTSKEQHVRGRRELYETSFDDVERDIVRQMSGALAPGGFDAERDIAAITVNRWPHGYAYEYNELFDPPHYNRYHGPHLAGAAQMRRISIANSDASGYAYVNGAFDAADRAVDEQLKVS
mgnify:CR=1 FL=1